MRAGLQALGAREARTEAGSPDPALRGRTYAIPFDRVWNAALALAAGGMPAWQLERSDDLEGVIEAVGTAPLLGVRSEATVRIGLDANGQTRVDAELRSTGGKAGLGMHRRHIRRFMAALDARLGAGSAEILEDVPGGGGS